MEQYINKSTLVAEIKTRIETYNKGYANGDDRRADALETFLHDIDFLEVKEVDLDAEFDKYCETLYLIDLENEPYSELFECAKYFYELGLKVQKGE